MNNFVKSMFNLRELEQLARRQQWTNGLSPRLKILATLIYIVIVSATGRYNLSGTLMLGVYPILAISLADIPWKTLLSKLVIPACFAVSLGLFNPILDREVMLIVGSMGISGGFVSLLTLFAKAMLTISATLILVATTAIEDLGQGLERMFIPKPFVMVLLMTYRYITVLLNEVRRTIEAYQLRSGNSSIHISTWGSLVGQIALGSFRRSEEIYNAMVLRGYGQEKGDL